MSKILIIEDEMTIVDLISFNLKREGFEIDAAYDGISGLEKALSGWADLILLDVMMPKLNGWDVCREVRRESSTPIIMLTARSEEDDELQGFELGADEYIAKPFSLKILTARIEAVLRRRETAPPPAEMLHIDHLAREVKVDGALVPLTYTEFELLEYLITNKGLALSRDKILDSVWRYDYDGDARTVDTHIKKLRSKLGEAGEMIKTIRGIGYKFEG